MRRRLIPLLTVVGLAGFATAVFLRAPQEGPTARTLPTGPARPAPTENILGTAAEGANKSARKAWFRELQKAPPGVDVHAVERTNGLAQIEKRNALAGAPPPPDGESWTERGSSNQAGRMHAAAHSPDHATLYGGSAMGGVWRGDLDGTDWAPIGDNLFGGAHWLAAVSGPDGDVVLAATDWGWVHRTEDDGATWTVPTGLGSPWQIRRVLTLSDGSESVFGVLRGDRGTWLVRSVDSVSEFEEVYDLEGFAGDLWAPRDGGDTLYLMTAEGLRWSDDAGETWTLSGALPGGPWSQARITGSEAGGPRLWAMVSNDDETHLVRSDDAGLTWETQLTEVEDYWSALNASITDVDRFAWGGVEVHVTVDGAESWDVVNEWHDYYDDVENLLHADIQGLDVFTGADGEELWYISTDGGVYRSTDGLDTVKNLSLHGLRISQYYSTLTSSANPEHVAAGAQDQGYQVTQGMDQDGDILAFDQLISGDYGHLTSGDGTHGVVFSVYPTFMLVAVGEDDVWFDYPRFPDGETQAWLPPVVADPQAPDNVFFCATHLWYYRATAEGWIPELWSEHDFQETEGEYLSAFALSPVSPARAFAATNYGRMFWSDDRGRTWTEAQDDGPAAHYFYGTALLPSRVDPDLVTAGGSGYGGPAAYRSLDGGRTWESWSNGLPDTTVYSLAEAPDRSGRLVAGTYTAAYQRDPEDTEWRDISGADAPVTIYWSAEALTDENAVRFGTYGRGIWDYSFAPTGDCVAGEDADGDGVPCQDDCDDTDAERYPGAADPCDGVDQDCDPDSPNEVDLDGDGYPACDDCNDDRVASHPGAAEICGNGIDENCDGRDSDLSECDGAATLDDEDKCGCASSGGAAPGLGLALLGLVGARRRRRTSVA
jgi:MYXO-CTERM domain-containing protein